MRSRQGRLAQPRGQVGVSGKRELWAERRVREDDEAMRHHGCGRRVPLTPNLPRRLQSSEANLGDPRPDATIGVAALLALTGHPGRALPMTTLTTLLLHVCRRRRTAGF